MTDRFDPDLPSDDDPFLETDLGPLASLLGDAAVWEEPAPDLEDAVVAAIHREMAAPEPRPDLGPASEPRVDPGPAIGPEADEHRSAEADRAEVIPIERARRRWLTPVLAAAAAALIAVAAFGLGAGILDRADGPDIEVALAGTDLAPTASAAAEVTATPLGTRIILDITGLEPAPEGRYYEAWLRQSPEIGISAGTFHLRGGDGSIELWSGVTVDRYPLITVTIQDEDGGEASSGRVVLAGRVDG